MPCSVNVAIRKFCNKICTIMIISANGIKQNNTNAATSSFVDTSLEYLTIINMKTTLIIKEAGHDVTSICHSPMNSFLSFTLPTLVPHTVSPMIAF